MSLDCCLQQGQATPGYPQIFWDMQQQTLPWSQKSHSGNSIRNSIISANYQFNLEGAKLDPALYKTQEPDRFLIVLWIGPATGLLHVCHLMSWPNPFILFSRTPMTGFGLLRWTSPSTNSCLVRQPGYFWAPPQKNVTWVICKTLKCCFHVTIFLRGKYFYAQDIYKIILHLEMRSLFSEEQKCLESFSKRFGLRTRVHCPIFTNDIPSSLTSKTKLWSCFCPEQSRDLWLQIRGLVSIQVYSH